jgi:hypothetical protein
VLRPGLLHGGLEGRLIDTIARPVPSRRRPCLSGGLTMLTPRVLPLRTATCHGTTNDAPDRELRCLGCGSRMFSSDAPALLASGMRCSLCLGDFVLVPLAGH